MKISKIILALVFTFLFLFIPQTIFCQTEKIDIIQYTPPKDWKKTPKDGLVVYNIFDKTTGGYCLLTVYPSIESVGDSKKDFATQWNERVVKAFKAEENPKTETQTDNGWTSVSAATQFESDGVKSAVMMTVISGYGRTASVLALLNNQEFFPQVDAFMTSIKMDKDQAIADVTPTPTTPTAPTAPTAPTTPVANSYDPAALVGKWSNGTSGGAIGYGTNASQKQYTFNADGTYSFDSAGWSGTVGYAGAFHIQTHETGVYTINGDSMTITPKTSKTTSNSEVTQKPLEIVTYSWTIHYFEGIKEYALIMHPDHQTKRDGEFDYLGGFPNSYYYSPMKK
jgi:hypothetical protein